MGSKLLIAEVNTFSPPAELAEALAPWAARLREELVEPFWETWPTDRRYGHVDIIPWAGASSQEHPYSARAWTRAAERFARGELSYLGITAAFGEDADAAADELGDRNTVAFAFDLGGEEMGHAHRVWFHVTGDLLDGAVPRELQERFLAMVAGLARAADAATGFITYDHGGGDESPFELGTGRPPEVALRECEHILRGYYWANILSKHHIDVLGGLMRVREEAPAVAADVIDEHAPVILLRLTGDINQVSDEELAALRAYLQPVLPPDRGYDPYYEGPPPRLVEAGASNAPAEQAAANTTGGVVFYGTLPNPAELQLDAGDTQLVTLSAGVEVERTRTFEEELPDVYVTVYFERALTADERAEFDRVIAAWQDLGAHAGFGDAFRNGSNVDYTQDDGERVAEFWADIGESGETAVDALIHAVQGLAEIDRIPVRRILFGTRAAT